MAARVLCPRRARACRAGRRCTVAQGGALALEEALGVHFEGGKGCSLLPFDPGANALLRRLFCLGAVGAADAGGGKFNWHEAVWHLRAPVLRALFQQLSDPGRLQLLGLVEVLDWTSAALER